MNKNLNKYKIYGKYRFKKIFFLSKFDERTGIITKHNPIKIYNKYLSLIPGIPRIMTAYENSYFILINIHLEYKSKLANNIGLNKIYKFISKHRDKSIVLLGDFNTYEDNPKFIEFENKLEEINIKRINNETRTFSNRQIDYIFLSNNINLIDIWTDKTIMSISDHRPIFIKIGIKINK